MNTSRIIILNGSALLLALGCTACASSMERPEQQLASAETSIELAEQNDAREFAPAALERAQTQYKQAKTAAANEEYESAERLAKRAELDAELAMAETSNGKAMLALQELQESIQALRREIARNQSS